MKTFAIIENENVVNIIVADSLKDAQIAGNVIEYDQITNPVGIGWTYNGTTFEQPLIEVNNE